MSWEPGPPLERRRVTVAPAPDCDATCVRDVRLSLNVSQGVFADLLNVALGTVRHWEQGDRLPDGGSLRLLELARRHPEIWLALMTPKRKGEPIVPEEANH